jgi:hypothetical protein
VRALFLRSTRALFPFAIGEYLSLVLPDAHGRQRKTICDFVFALLSVRTGCQADCNSVDGTNSVARYFNTAAFAPAPDFRRGTAGVGIIQGPGTQLWDISVRKKIIFTEARNLELRADFFNAFNRTNFRNVQTNLSDGAYGRLTSSGVARNIQLALRFTF